MLIVNDFKFGDLDSKIYTFGKIGDELESHEHTKQDLHITIVCKGSFTLELNGAQKTIKAGDVFDFKENQTHGFTALEDNSKIINIRKHLIG